MSYEGFIAPPKSLTCPPTYMNKKESPIKDSLPLSLCS